MKSRQSQYPKQSWLARIAKKEIIQPIAWGLTGIASLCASAILIPKAALNYLMGNKKDARNNAVSALTLYPALTATSVVSFVSPDQTGNRLARTMMLPVRAVYSLLKPIPNQRSLQQELASQATTHVASTDTINMQLEKPLARLPEKFYNLRSKDLFSMLLKMLWQRDASELSSYEPQQFYFPPNCRYERVMGADGVQIDSVDRTYALTPI